MQLTQKQGDKERRLHRTNAAAGLVNSHPPGADLNDVAVLDRGDAQKPHGFNRDGGDVRHQPLDEGLLKGDGPGNGNERKTNRESEVPQPRPSPRIIEAGQSQENRLQAMNRKHQPPFRIGLLDEPDGQQGSQGRKGEEKKAPTLAGSHRWPAAPAGVE